MHPFVFRLDTDQTAFRYAEKIIDHSEKEFHNQHEIYFLWEGNVELVSESGRKQLAPNTAVIIPKECFHQFIISDPGSTYIRCNLKFRDIPELKDLIPQKTGGLLLLQDDRITSIFQRLREIVYLDKRDVEKKLLLRSYLTEILVMLPASTSDQETNFSSLSAVTRNTILHIQDHIAENLEAKAIASALHFSPSYLSHIFKKDMGISLHKYILNKRLVQANIRIRQGCHPLHAAEKCGFRDYSNFYTQYKKRFGYPPSKSDVFHIHPEDI